MKIKINADVKAVIIDNKKFLQENNLAGFYEKLANIIHHTDGYYELDGNNIPWETMEMNEVSQFLDENGIYIEDYMNYIPDFYCYLPKRWLGKNEFFWLPDNIKSVNWMGFTEVRTKGIVFTNVSKLESFILEDAEVDVAVFTDKLRLATKDSLKFTNLKKVLIPRQYLDDIKSASSGIQHIVAQCEDDNIKVMGYTNL